MKFAVLMLMLTASFTGCTSIHSNSSGCGYDKPVNVHGETLSGIDVEFPCGLFRGLFTLCQIPFEVPRAAVVLLSDDKSDAPIIAKLITLPITWTIGSTLFCTARTLAGGFDLLTFGVCGELFYGNLIAPFIWEEQWVGTIKSSQDCIRDARMRRSIPPDSTSESSACSVSESEPADAPAPENENYRSDAGSAPAEEFRDKRYCGRWDTTQIAVMKLSGGGISGEKETESVLKSEYVFRQDGEFNVITVVSGKETVSRGRWKNEDGCLVVRFNIKPGQEVVCRLKPIWQSSNELEMRHEDVDAFARLLIATGAVKTAKAHYDSQGIMHVTMEIGNHTLNQMLHRWIFIRNDKQGEQ